MSDSEELCPDEEDIYVSDCGPLGSESVAHCGHKQIAHSRHGDLDTQIRAWMEKEQFFPSIWRVSDHGNLSPYSLEDSQA